MADQQSLTLAQITALVKLAKRVEQFNNLLSGSGPPTTQGSEGDWYIDVATKELYGPRSASGWNLQAVELTTSEKAENKRMQKMTDLVINATHIYRCFNQI